MITDFIKFIFRVIILNPMALIGIAVGVYIMQNGGLSYIQQIIAEPQAYIPHALGALWGAALLYALLFKHVYHIDGKKINWWGTFTSSFWHLFIILLAAFLTCVIYWCVNYDWGDKLDRYARNQRTQDSLPPINQ